MSAASSFVGAVPVRADRSWTTIGRCRLAMLARWRLCLPMVQRPQEWSQELQAAYVRAFWEGRPLWSPIILWRRHNGNVAVLDGQQRLHALGVTLEREDLTTMPPPACGLDLGTGAIVRRDRPEVFTMAQLISSDHVMALKDRTLSPERRDVLIDVVDRVTGRELTCLTLDEEEPEDRVIEHFRSANTPGVQMPLAQLEALLANARRL